MNDDKNCHKYVNDSNISVSLLGLNRVSISFHKQFTLT